MAASLSPISIRSTSPYTTAPSSPKLLSYLSDDDDLLDSDFEFLDSVCSFVPFNWEEKPGKPKTFIEDEEFAFEFRVEKNLSLPAEDLFDEGKIKPLKPPPRLQLESDGVVNLPLPISGRKSVSLCSRQMIVDPFEAAIESARNGDDRVETASFGGSSSRFKRLRNLISFRRWAADCSKRNEPGLGMTGRSGSGSGSSSASGSVSEPDNGYEVGGRSLPLCRPHLFSCFMESI